jgi:hypothetical protein
MRSVRRQILELEINGHADLIVSSDGDLLALNPRDPDRAAGRLCTGGRA